MAKSKQQSLVIWQAASQKQLKSLANPPHMVAHDCGDFDGERDGVREDVMLRDGVGVAVTRRSTDICVILTASATTKNVVPTVEIVTEADELTKKVPNRLNWDPSVFILTKTVFWPSA